MKLEAHKPDLPESKEVRKYLDSVLRIFAYQSELFDNPEIAKAREQLRVKLQRGEQIPIKHVQSLYLQEDTEYVLPDGTVTHSEKEFMKAIKVYGLRQFVSDTQLRLFPDQKVEQVRADLRKRLASGESIDSMVVYSR